ncbi:MAG: arginine deiminase-related protein [Bdellovibrionota bacterium]
MILLTPQCVTARVHHESSPVPGGAVLLVKPDHFKIAYAINPHMREPDGSLKKVDSQRAIQQWESLKSLYESLGLRVDVLGGQEFFPDMVFAANQGFVFWDGKKPSVILSTMASTERQGEIEFFESYYKECGYNTFSLSSYGEHTFEGNGDALLHPNGAFIWGGFGFRTSEAAYEAVARLTQLPVAPLRLVDEHCYHLDTCFSILDEKTVAIQASAFDGESLSRIRAGFERVIEIDAHENREAFAGNCFCPNGKDVVLNPGAPKFVAELKKAGFTVHERDTSEFIKSGGSVFCLKMVVF